MSAILTKFEEYFTELQSYLKKNQKSEIELDTSKVDKEAEGLPVKLFFQRKRNLHQIC